MGASILSLKDKRKMEIRIVNDDNEQTGAVIMTLVPGQNVVDIVTYRGENKSHEMRVMMDSIERQLPAALKGVGLKDEDQIEKAAKEGVSWAVEVTGGAEQNYIIGVGDSAVHAITYSDGQKAMFHMYVDRKGVPRYDYEKVEIPDDASYHVTGTDELDEGGNRRAVISRERYPTHVVLWRAVKK